jgi:long-chain fatty acid transport protein
MDARSTRIRLVTVLLTSALALVSAPLNAHPFDTFGVSSRLIGMGGGATASAAGPAAAYYNPASLGGIRGASALVGGVVAHRRLDAAGADLDTSWRGALVAGLSAPLPLGELLQQRVYLGALLSLPSRGIYSLDLPDDRSVSFPMLGDRTERLAAMGALSLRIFEWWSLGVGAALLPDVSAVVRVDLRGVGGRNEAAIEVGYSPAATAGATFRPLEWLALGLTWRGGHHTRVELFPIEVDVADNLDPVRANVTATSYAVPHEVALGVAATPHEDFSLAADLTWSHFGGWRIASPEVSLCAACPRDCSAGGCPAHCTSNGCSPSFEEDAPFVDLHDTLAPRAGAEWRATEGLALRVGYGWQPSPFPDQQGTTNLMDADRHVVSAGVGWTFVELPAGWPQRASVDAHAQVHVMPELGWDKAVTDADGDGIPDLYVPPTPGTATTWPTLRGEALLLAFGLDLSVEF